MKRFLGGLVGVGAFLVLIPCVLAGAETPQKFSAAPQGFDARRDDIERGKVETIEYDSKAVGAKRKMVIYTPPGYSKDAKYPVFYLLHGAGDDETGWLQKGSADAILDNLYADKKIVPMIVVMPNGFARRPGTAKPQTAKPETAKPETAKSGTAKPGAGKRGGMGRDNAPSKTTCWGTSSPMSSRTTRSGPAASRGPWRGCRWGADRP